jgi:fatty acid desaturase
MTHTQILKQLSAARKTHLIERSDRAGLIHLALYLGALAISTTAIVAQVPFWVVCVPVQGILLCFLFTLSHECTHQTPFKSKWINETVGHLCAVPIALPFVWFRYFHLAHHKYTNDPERDPELDGGGRPAGWRGYLVYLSGWGYWKNGLTMLWINAFGTPDAPYLSDRLLPRLRREARIILALYAAAAISLLFTPVLFWVWLLPVLVGQPVLRAYLLAEHGLCPPVEDMLENSRTTYTTRLIRFLAWNMPYHAEHHSFPAVPFYRLPEFHDDVQAHLKSTSDGYGAFTAEYVRHLAR